MEWDKIFANHILNKGLVSTIHKEHIQLSNKEHKQPGCGEKGTLIHYW